MKIPKNILDEIEQRSNIVDIIGSYVSLQKAGSNFKGLCPFHSEKTPSFVVLWLRCRWRRLHFCYEGGERGFCSGC